MSETPEWGWRVVDPDGNVVDEGPQSEVSGLADFEEE